MRDKNWIQVMNKSPEEKQTCNEDERHHVPWGSYWLVHEIEVSKYRNKNPFLLLPPVIIN